MSFQTGYIALNSQPTNWNQVLTDFQVESCDGEPVGDSVAVMQAIVLNKLMVHICNAGSVGTGIVQALGEYNEPSIFWLRENGATITLDEDTYHSVSIKVVDGECDLTVNGTQVTMTAGESNSWTATKLLSQAFELSLTTPGKVVITTLQ